MPPPGLFAGLSSIGLKTSAGAINFLQAQMKIAEGKVHTAVIACDLKGMVNVSAPK